INTPVGAKSKYDDSYIRLMAIQYKIPYVTSMAAARASAEGIESVIKGDNISLRTLQEYHGQLKD
ncbi:MAG: hypothetical protein ABIA77_07190, partial [Candidatus Omnitrophota bacterium]